MGPTMNESKGGSQRGEVPPDDCFAEQMKMWIWVFGAIIVFLIGFSVLNLSHRKGLPVAAGGPSGGQVQAQQVAVSFCPYCSGLLDGQGRCNVLECPVYSPNWGRPAALQTENPVQRVLLKKLAIEVGLSPKKGSVDVCSVYGGGWAAKGGLNVGDMIVRFNGRRVKDITQFKKLVAGVRPESKVNMHIVRNGKRMKLSVMIGEGEMEGVTMPNTIPAAWSAPQSNQWGYRR